jgi:hypothetical protein
MRVPIVAALLGLALQAVAQQPAIVNDAVNIGLRGPVHKVQATVIRLDKDPRLNPKLTFWPFNSDTVFDRSGRIIEQGSASADGTSEAITHIEYDAQGNKRTWVERNGAVVAASATKFVTQGTASETYSDGKLVARSVPAYDEQGNVLSSATYDGSGNVLMSSTNRYDSSQRLAEYTVTGSNNCLVVHVRQNYDANGDLNDREELNAAGQTVRSMVFRAEHLVSWWQSPEPQQPLCGGSSPPGFFNRAEGWAVFYQIQPDGSLQSTVQHYPKGGSNIENDDVERLDGNGGLLEKLTFRYQRDALGNWTVRSVSAWDPQTGIMVPIEEDHRTITYY